jgi:hypothetical protein
MSGRTELATPNASGGTVARTKTRREQQSELRSSLRELTRHQPQKRQTVINYVKLQAALRLSISKHSGSPKSLFASICGEHLMASLAVELAAELAVKRHHATVPNAGMAADFVGTWRNVETTGLDPYLKALNVGWAKRKLAGSFRPEPVFSLDDGILRMVLGSPIGERIETFPIDVEVEDCDPSGNKFTKVSIWEGKTLRSTARRVTGNAPDFVTTRLLRDDGKLVQRTSHNGMSFERVFERKMEV